MQNMLAALRAGVPLARLERWRQRATPDQLELIDGAINAGILVESPGGGMVTIDEQAVHRNRWSRSTLDAFGLQIGLIEETLRIDLPHAGPAGGELSPKPARPGPVLRRMEAGPVVIAGAVAAAPATTENSGQKLAPAVRRVAAILERLFASGVDRSANRNVLLRLVNAETPESFGMGTLKKALDALGATKRRKP
ncbi:MAG: hypothetical protein JOY71_23205 [Acetobacteraceae bacterium]|nr:hypothetical protein [Acetobacteraceae bacterium]